MQYPTERVSGISAAKSEFGRYLGRKTQQTTTLAQAPAFGCLNTTRWQTPTRDASWNSVIDLATTIRTTDTVSRELVNRTRALPRGFEI
jgi:hypothetical protein